MSSTAIDVATAPVRLTRYAWLSVAASILTIALKSQAYLMTGSVGLLSDAAESVVNLVAALVALWMLSLAARPADAGHPFGHGKAEYLASGLEGALIIVAAGGIAITAWERFQAPQPLNALSVGIAVSGAAGLVNLVVALILLKAGRRHRSITLEADAKHLLSDVWTTAAILAALGAVAVTGWQVLDPAIAMLAALHIVWSGAVLMARSVGGLLDSALPDEDLAEIRAVLGEFRARGCDYHDLRTRIAGAHRLMTVHLLVPGELTVSAGHALAEELEGSIRQRLGAITIVTHVEPANEAVSFEHDQLREVPPIPVRVASHADEQPRGRRLQLQAGLLFVVSSAASMALTGWHADAAMGTSLVALLVLLGSIRLGRPRNGEKG